MEAPAALHFQGPFTFVDHGRGIASCEFAASEGIYLWVKTDGQRRYIHYVGETTAFLKRHKEHLTQKLGLNYGVFRADAVAADDPAPIYGGMWRDKSEDPLTRTVQAWLRLQQEILASVESVEVFFAPTALTNEMRKHVEGCPGAPVTATSSPRGTVLSGGQPDDSEKDGRADDPRHVGVADRGAGCAARGVV